MKTLTRLMRTNHQITLTIIRVILGLVFLPHGAQKLLGWFGGSGFSATMHMFETRYQVPSLIAFLAIAAEFFGGLGLVFGLLSRIAAFGIAANMLVAIFAVHHVNGFFMNWSGRQKGEGIEYHLLVLAMTAAIIVGGSGALSLDRFITGRITVPTAAR